MSDKTVKDVMLAYMDANGYDGLYDDTGECGCVKSDLMPCGCANIDCRFGVRVPGESSECGWAIIPKPTPAPVRECGTCGTAKNGLTVAECNDCLPSYKNWTPKGRRE